MQDASRFRDSPKPKISIAKAERQIAMVVRIPSRRTTVEVESAPTTAPTLKSANKPPYPPAPSPSTFFAMTDSSASTGAPNKLTIAVTPSRVAITGVWRADRTPPNSARAPVDVGGSCRFVRIMSSAAMTAMKLSALIANAQPAPHAARINPPIAGPTTRARDHCVELSDTASRINRDGMRSGMSA